MWLWFCGCLSWCSTFLCWPWWIGALHQLNLPQCPSKDFFVAQHVSVAHQPKYFHLKYRIYQSQKVLLTWAFAVAVQRGPAGFCLAAVSAIFYSFPLLYKVSLSIQRIAQFCSATLIFISSAISAPTGPVGSVSCLIISSRCIVL